MKVLFGMSQLKPHFCMFLFVFGEGGPAEQKLFLTVSRMILMKVFGLEDDV